MLATELISPKRLHFEILGYKGVIHFHSSEAIFRVSATRKYFQVLKSIQFSISKEPLNKLSLSVLIITFSAHKVSSKVSIIAFVLSLKSSGHSNKPLRA